MKPYKALFRQLFGAGHERITKSLLVCLIPFLSLYAAEIRVAIAPSVLFLAAALLSFGAMWQGIHAAGNADWLMGLYALPFRNRAFLLSYLLAFGSHTLLTKSLPVLAVFWAVGTWSPAEAIMSVLCACQGCILAAALHAMLAGKHRIPAAVCGACTVLPVLLAKPLALLGGILVSSTLAARLYLFTADAYVFYRPVPAKKLLTRSGRKGDALLYLLRYLFTNKNYLLNTAVLWGIACFLPSMLGMLEGLNAMPLGLAILCINTPLGILISCNPGLEQALRVLPGQAIRFCTRYCFFLFSVSLVTDSIYLISWQMQHGGVGISDLLMAVLFALQSAILSVLLEWLRPIRSWNIESDLWHHPRKYLVPLLMMLIAGFVGIWPCAMWIWLSLLLAECCSLLWIARRS